MITTLKNKIIFKTIAGAVVFSFLWQQILWAGDLAEQTIDKVNADQSQMFAPAYLQDQQAIHEELVSQRQAVEDTLAAQSLTTTQSTHDLTQADSDIAIKLQGSRGGDSGQAAAITAYPALTAAPTEDAATSGDNDAVLSVTTQAGDIIHYLNNQIASIERKDGTVLRDLVIDENNNLVAANITYEDGTNEIVANGKVTKITKFDGTIFNYNEEGLILSILYPDNKTANLSYIKDGEGAIVETILTGPDKVSYYGSDNKLTKVEFNTGKKIEYKDGVISKITEEDNGVFTFDITPNLDSTITSGIVQYQAANGSIYRYNKDENGSLLSIAVEKNGMVGAYNKDGVLLSVAKDGQAVTDVTIAQVRTDYDTALAAYQEKKQYEEICQTNLNSVDTDLKNKTTAKDAATANLNAAIQILNSAQFAKDTKRSAYDASYNDYIAAQATCDAADAALNNAKALEAQVQQDLASAQNTLTAMQTTLSNKIATRQATQSTIAELNNTIQTGQADLAQVRQNLNQALSEESTAQPDYDKAQTDVNTNEAVYDNLKQDRVNKEGIFNAASKNLANKADIKNQAYQRLQAALRNHKSNWFLKIKRRVEYYIANYNYLQAKTIYDNANNVLNNARILESQARQALTDLNNIKNIKKTVLDNKISARKGLETIVMNINSRIQAYQRELNNVNNQLIQAKDEEAVASNEYASLQTDVSTKEAVCNSVVQARQTEEAAFSAANAALPARTALKNKTYADLQTALTNLSSAQSAKNTSQLAYDSAHMDYLSTQTAHDQVLIILNNTRSERDAAKTLADSLLKTLNILSAASSTFSSQDNTLADANNELNLVSVLYDAKRQVQQVYKMDGAIQNYTEGLVNSILNGSGSAIYSYDLNALNTIKGITVDRDGIKRIYDAYGNLSSLTLADKTKITYDENSNGKNIVSSIEKASSVSSDNAEIRNMVYDAAGKLVSCDVIEADGSVAAYVNGEIDHKVSPDNTVFRYVDRKIDTVENADGKIYKYIYQNDTIRKDLIQFNLSDGSILKLKNEEIASVTLPDGTLFTSPRFDLDGILRSADVALSDGRRGAIEDGALVKLILTDNTEIYYEDKRIRKILKSGAGVLDFSYSLDAAGGIGETIVTENGEERRYDKDGSLTAVSSDLRKITYEGSKIKTIFIDEPGIFIQDPVFDDQSKLSDGIIKTPDGVSYILRNGKPAVIITPGGARISYGGDGAILSIEKGSVTEQYIYRKDAGGNLISIDVDNNRSGSWVREDVVSYLRKITDSIEETVAGGLLSDVPYFQILKKADFGKIDITDWRWVTNSKDPSIKFEINYDLSAESKDAYVGAYLDFGSVSCDTRLVNIKIRKDAATAANVPIAIEFYNDDKLVSSQNMDNLSSQWQERTFYFPVNGLMPTRVAFRIQNANAVAQKGTFYLSDIVPVQVKSAKNSGWSDSFIPSAAFIASCVNIPKELSYSGYSSSDSHFGSLDITEFFGATPLYSIYDASDKLKQIKRTDNSIVNFADSRPDNMIEPGGSVIDYQYEGLCLKRASIFPEKDLTRPQVVLEYSGNRITRAIKDDTIYTYSYETSTGGEEVISVKNESTKYLYKYQNEKLVSTISPDGLMTEYSYLNSRIDSAVVTLDGRKQETFKYGYADDLTIVTDEKEIKRTYDSGNRLIYLETPEGLGYKYNYTDDGNGKNVLEVELYQASGKDGVIIYHKDGNVDSIQLKDGMIIEINDSENKQSLKNMTVNDGLVQSVTYETGEVATYIRDDLGLLDSIKVEKDGVKRWYNKNGELTRLQTSPGEYYLYGYTRKDNGGIDKIKVTKVTLFEIGGAVPPVKLYSYSAGYDDGWDAGILVNDKGAGSFNTNWWWSQYGESWCGRGYDVVVVDGLSGSVKSMDLFDIYGKGTGEADRMAGLIESVSRGDYVIMAIGDEGSVNMTERARRAIESIGSTMIRSVGNRDSWTIIGCKGALPGTVLEKYNEHGTGPAILPGYRTESFYYDKDGNFLSFDAFKETADEAWFSVRPTHITDDMEILSRNSQGDACGYIKNFNSQYPDSGFIRIWDEMDVPYDALRMEELSGIAGNKKNKAVYYDPRYPTNWITEAYALKMKNFFQAKGYTILNADELRCWLKTNGPDSVLIMSQDIAPSTIVSKYTSDSPVREYLENGGTFVWTHDMPFHYIGYSDRSKYDLGENGQRRILGIITAIEPRVGDKYTKETCVIPLYTVPDGQKKIDLSLLNFDFSVNYRDISWNKIRESIGYELKEDTAVVSEYDSDGKIVSVAKSDRTVSVYKDDKVSFVTDLHGDIITDYTYDKDGNIVSIDMAGARRDIKYKIAEAKNQMSKEKALQLEELALQKGLIIDQIKGWADSERSRLYEIRGQYQSQLSNLEGQHFWWASQKRQKSIAMDQIRAAIVQVNSAICGVNDEESRQMAALDGEIANVCRQIEESASAALADVEGQKLKLLNELSLEEARPVVHEYYRQILGRDPGTAEIDKWMEEIKASPAKTLNIDNLKNYIYNSSEYLDRVNKVNNIRGEIEGLLNGYLNASEQDKNTFLSSLKLLPSDIVALSKEDVSVILIWLKGQNVHFGRSAANILGNLLKDKNTPYVYENLIRDAILVDILTGSINRFIGGDLVISAYALRKVASLYNLNITPVRITFEKLKELINSQARGEAKVVVLIGGNHYVIVTGINELSGEVTYVETSKGPSGEIVVTSISEFRDAWQGGYAITQEYVSDKDIILSDYQSQKVRGACLPFLIPLIAFLFQAAAFVIQGVAAAIIMIAQAVIVPVVQAALNLIVGFVSGLAQGIAVIGKALFVGIKFAGMSLFKGFASFFALGGTFGAGSSSASAMPGIVGFAVKTAVNVVVNYGINAGLDALGVSPVISRLVSAFTTGGIAGGGGSLANFFSFKDALGALAIQGVNSFGAKMNLPSPVLDALSIASGALVNGIFTIGTNIQDLVSGVAINLGTEMAYIGVQQAGQLLGVDPRISYLAGVGLRSTLNMGLSEGFEPAKIWGSVEQGLLQGVTNIGLNFATQELGLNPLLANMGFSAISGAINAGIQAAAGGSNDVFGALFKTYKDNALTFLGYGDPTNAWQQAAYISQIFDFSNIVKEGGLIEALNTYGTSFFNSVAVNNIVQSGYTLGGYFAEKLNTGQYATRTLQDGKQVKEVLVKDTQDNTVAKVLFQQKQVGETTYWDIVGKEDLVSNGSYLGWGDLGVDAYGKLGYTDAELYSIFNSDVQYQRVIGGQQAYAEIKDSTGKTLLIIEPAAGGSYNVYNSYGEYVDAKITNLISDRSYTFDDLKLNYFSELDSDTKTSLLDLDLSNPDLVNLMFNSLSMSSSEAAAFNNLTLEEKRQVLHILLFNGLGNPESTGISPGYMRGFGAQLALADPVAIQTTYIASYENSPGLIGVARNCGVWLKDVYLSSDEVTDDILREIYHKFNGNPPTNMAGLAYSGDGDPLLQALNKNSNLDMKSVVLVGAPLKYGRKIMNPNVENVIMIGGDLDYICQAGGGVPFQDFAGSVNQINTYKIILKGVDHCNYTYDPNKPNPNPLAVEAARFVTRATLFANNKTKLDTFLNTQVQIGAVTYSETLKLYVVDLGKVQYEQ